MNDDILAQAAGIASDAEHNSDIDTALPGLRRYAELMAACYRACLATGMPASLAENLTAEFAVDYWRDV